MRKILYVSNVSRQADLCALEILFATVGDVTAQHLELIPESGHKGTFGVFELSTHQQAADCIERFQGQIVNGIQLAIVSERPKLRPKVILAPKSKKASRKHGL